jgi:hypothetical protein
MEAGFTTTLKSEFNNPSLEKRIASMDAQGIDIEAMSVNAFWYGADRELARRLIDVQNEGLSKMCKASDGRLIAFATVALQFPDLAAEQLEHATKHLGLRGAAIGGEFAAFLALVVTEKGESALIEAFEKHDAGGGLTARGIHRGEGHGIGLHDAALLCLVEPEAELGEGILIDFITAQAVAAVFHPQISEGGDCFFFVAGWGILYSHRGATYHTPPQFACTTISTTFFFTNPPS